MIIYSVFTSLRNFFMAGFSRLLVVLLPELFRVSVTERKNLLGHIQYLFIHFR
jgi:hypothetical protein